MTLAPNRLSQCARVRRAHLNESRDRILPVADARSSGHTTGSVAGTNAPSLNSATASAPIAKSALRAIGTRDTCAGCDEPKQPQSIARRCQRAYVNTHAKASSRSPDTAAAAFTATSVSRSTPSTTSNAGSPCAAALFSFSGRRSTFMAPISPARSRHLAAPLVRNRAASTACTTSSMASAVTRRDQSLISFQLRID